MVSAERSSFLWVCNVRGPRRRPSQPFPGVDNIQPLLEAKENLGLPCEKALKSVEDSNEGELDLEIIKYILKLQ